MGQAGSHTVGAVGPHGGESRRSFGNAGTFQATRLQSSGEEGKEFSPFAITAGKHSTRMASSNAGYRPRATTESGHRPAIRAFRQHTVDDSGKMSKHHDDLSSGASSVGSGQAIIVSGGEKRLPTIFKFPGQGKEVFVSGTFNGWQKLRMNRSAKDFVAIVELAEGNHEYKFLVDGEWVNDPNAPVIENESGFKNNLIKVQKSDFDAYEALDMDSAAVANLTALKRQQHAAMASNNFSQEIPSNTLFENRSGPPILPPHLLQVILNKDTPMSCEPTLLPEPNHVMLNHLYALSIKDGVMVLSSTHRYRRKYVTSLLYKPMGNRKIEST